MSYLVADLSTYQTGINMAAVKTAGATAVILKATEGTGYRSPAFRAQAQQAAAQGLIVSAYHFLRPGDGAGQARYFLAALAGVIAPGVRVWADFEAAGTTHQTLHDFTATVAAARPVGVYSYGPFWVANGQASCAHCADLPLWFARYGSKPTAPPPWSHVSLWQYTDKFPVDGRLIDMSTTDDLAVLTGGATPTPEDDMPLTEDEMNRIADKVWQKQQPASFFGGATPLQVLQDTRIDSGQGKTLIAQAVANDGTLAAALAKLSLPAGITAEALAKALLEQLAAK